MSSLQNDFWFSSSPQCNQGQVLQPQSVPAVEYNFFSTPSSPEPLVPRNDLLPDFHAPNFYTFSATSSPTFEESLGLPLSPVSEALSTYKSTSRLRSGNRVPRPRNAFMIFRSEFWAGEKISRSVEHDHRHISRIVGHCWNQLPEAEKDKWREKAEQEKLDHIRKYPGYRFSPNARTKKAVKRKVKRNSAEELLRCKQVAELLLAGKQGVELDSAVKGMKSLLDDTALQSDSGRSSRPSHTSSPKNGKARRKSNSPTLDHIHIPIFRSPLLPPAQTLPNISPTHSQSPSSFQNMAPTDSYEVGAGGMTSQQHMSSLPFDLSSSGNLCQSEGTQQVPAYFDRPPSLDEYSLSTGEAGTTQQQSEGQMCLPYLQYPYEPTPDDFYNLSSSSVTQTASILGADPSAYSTMVPTRSQSLADPLMWDFSDLIDFL